MVVQNIEQLWLSTYDTVKLMYKNFSSGLFEKDETWTNFRNTRKDEKR